MNELLAALIQNSLIEERRIVLDRAPDGFPLQIVEISDFEAMFGSALNNEDRYSALVAEDDNGDGTTKGYKRFFDAWRAAGII